METKAKGIVLICDYNGIVHEIVRDDFAIPLEQPFLFTRILEKSSISKGLSFLAELKTLGTTFNWELVLNLHDIPEVLFFSGGVINEKVFIVGAENSQETGHLFEELMKITNEQATTIRNMIKDQRSETAAYDEISRLNNELVTIQREMAKKNADLDHLNKEKNRFLGMAAHDLRNPLHGILLQCDYLLQVIEDEKYRDIITSIKEASEFMVGLIEDLLDYSKIEAGEVNLDYAQVDITLLVQDIIRINRPLAEQHTIALELKAEQIGQIYTDPGKISQILNNLISNAIKFSKSNTIIQVRLTDKGNTFTLEVQDQGKGMSLEQQDQLFKPFHKGERGLRGEKTTGLGLTIVKRIIDALGGELHITSQVGEGSTFSVTLPKIPKELQDS